MTTIDPSGYSEAGAHLFTWLADKVLGGAKKAFGWGWTQVEWAKAQDRYDARIIQDYGQIRIFGQTTPKSLKDIFTDVYVLDTPTAYRRFDPAALAEHLWNEDRGLAFRHEERRPGEQLLEQGSKFYILGKPGAGKTTFLKHLAVREAQRGKWGPCLGKIPIFVSLKQFGEKSQSLFDFIVDEFAVCGFPEATPFVEALLKSGQALVLFDGLDEVSKSEEHDRRGEVTRMLAQFARQYGECHIVVTCRIAAVDYTFEPAFAYLEMADFAPDQMDAFVRAWFWDDSDKDKGAALAEGMLAALELPEHKGIRDLSRNPLLLTLLCLNYAETLSFPARRVEIYEEALDALLKKWDSSRRIQRVGLYKTLSLGRKRQMFARIAFDAMTRGEVIMPKGDLERRLVEYLASVPELPTAVDIDGEAVLQEIIAQHGIFAEQARSQFSFAHLTFQEYFAGCYIADNSTSETLDEVLGHIADGRWWEVFLVSASLIPEATSWLISYDRALGRLAACQPKLHSWLRRIDAWASRSRTDYGRPAIRVFFAYVSALAGPLADPLALALAVDLAPKLAHDFALAYAINRTGMGLRILASDHFPGFVPVNEGTLALEGNLFIAGGVAHGDDLALVGAFQRDLTRILDRTGSDMIYALNDLADDLAATRDLDRISDLLAADSSTRTTARVRSFTSAVERFLDFCKLQSREDLRTRITELTTHVSDEPTVEAMQIFVTEFEHVIDASGVLTAFRQLEAESAALRQELASRWSLDDADIHALTEYTSATKLFYDCLQLAYTPDRHAFEERIFWLPPDLNQQ